MPGQKAYALAEAGVNNALAVLNQNYPCTACYPGNPALLPARATTYSTGSVSWSGTLQAAPLGYDWSDEWRLTATSTVPNPTGPAAAPITRTVKAVVPIIIPAASPIGDDEPTELHLREERREVPAVRDRRVACLRDDRPPSGEPGHDQRVHRERARDQEQDGRGRRLLRGSERQQGGARARYRATRRTTSRRRTSWAVATPSSTTTTRRRNRASSAAARPSTRSGRTRPATSIPPGFIDYIPELTCCAPYPEQRVAAPDRDAARRQQHGAGLQDCGHRTEICMHDRIGAASRSTARAGLDNLINNSATPTGTAAIDLTPASTYSCRSARGELSWNDSTKLRVKGPSSSTAAPRSRAHGVRRRR